ncbi:MAG: hypothetical protein K6D02_00145 [Lachnospiraceae bacterium]|nr:hypothetical protein [Lachnospiraceae bacterium]
MDRKKLIKRIVIIAGVAACALILGTCLSSAIGWIVGRSQGLKGIVAVRSGLATIGGGPIASGGRGMKGGKALIQIASFILGGVGSTVYFIIKDKLRHASNEKYVDEMIEKKKRIKKRDEENKKLETDVDMELMNLKNEGLNGDELEIQGEIDISKKDTSGKEALRENGQAGGL